MGTFFLTIFKCLFFVMLTFGIMVFMFVKYHPVFGGKPDHASWQRIKQSKQFNGKLFVNEQQTMKSTMESGASVLFDWFVSVVSPPQGKIPTAPLPNETLTDFCLNNEQFVWLGHSTVLFRLAGKTFVTDPVFYRASPVPFGGKPFALQYPIRLEDLPSIDVVLISHDHYDHLDYYTIRTLQDKVAHFFVPLGVKGHLQRWGVADSKITEMDWHEEAICADVSLTFTPTRHFSGRGVFNHGLTLWGSWVIKSENFSLFFSADSGYGGHFSTIGELYGPFTLAFMENGAYNDNWTHVHMSPEESVQAVLDVQARFAVPIHWAKFDLAFHLWKDPIQRFLREADKQAVRTITPRIGKVFGVDSMTHERWWNELI